jgi:hypothetical protein
MDPIEPPWLAIKEWIPDDGPDLDWFNRPRNPSNPDPEGFDQCPARKPGKTRWTTSAHPGSRIHLTRTAG